MALEDDLISYWKCDESSGNLIDAHRANDGTDTNTVGAATGIINNGRDFNYSASEHFTIASNTQMQCGDIDFTLAMWLKWETEPASGNDMEVFSKGSSFTSEYALLTAYPTPGTGFQDKPYFIVQSTVVYDTTGINTATWYFFVCWHDATNNLIGISRNGAAATTASHTHSGYTNSTSFYIGATSGIYSTFNGIIDEIGFWKRKLSSAEITELYNSGSGRDYDYVAPSGPPSESTTSSYNQFLHQQIAGS